jgi:hypothetical protein
MAAKRLVLHKWIALLGMALSAGVGQFGLVGCDIKGNVSLVSGERIYHLAGQR